MAQGAGDQKQQASSEQGEGRLSSQLSARLERLLDVEIPLVVLLGEKKMLLKDVLALTPGSIIDFEKSVNEPLSLLANNRLIARGETVKLAERFGLQITEIGTPAERVKALGGSE
jgi:flagellar motor switch protein FliN/FliY